MSIDTARCTVCSKQTALLFPGVGVGHVGHESKIFSAFESTFSPIFQSASGYCGEDLAAALFDDKVDSLSDRSGQVLTYAFSCGAASVAVDHLSPILAAGYSFGIYGALFAARVLSFEDGLYLLDKAHLIMAAAAKKGTYGMGVVLGLAAPPLLDIIAKEGLSETVRTNSNHELCHIFSGPLLEIDRLLLCSESAGALKAQRLDVTIPYHHPTLLADAPLRFAAFFPDVTWRDPIFPIVSSIDGALMQGSDAIKDFVARHLAEPIDWQQVCDILNNRGIEAAIECGPGISLSQNARFLPYKIKMLNAKKVSGCLSR